MPRKKTKHIDSEPKKGHDLSIDLMAFCGLSAIGFPFLIWFSTLWMWFLSMLFAALMACLNNQLVKRTKMEIWSRDDNPLFLLSFFGASAIYWSAFLFDPAGFCGKQYYGDFTPTLTFEGGRYGIEDKFSMRQGSGTRCDPGTVTPFAFVISAVIAIWFLFKTLYLVIFKRK